MASSAGSASHVEVFPTLERREMVSLNAGWLNFTTVFAQRFLEPLVEIFIAVAPIVYAKEKCLPVLKAGEGGFPHQGLCPASA